MTASKSPLLANVLRGSSPTPDPAPTAQAEQLNELLARSSDPTARNHAATSTRNPELLTRLAQDPADTVRWTVLENPAATPDVVLTVAARGGNPAQAAVLHPSLTEPQALTALTHARSGLRAHGLHNLDHTHLRELTNKPELATALTALLPYPALPTVILNAPASAHDHIRTVITRRMHGHHPRTQPKYDLNPEKRDALNSNASGYLMAACSAAGLDSTTRPTNGNQGDPALQWWTRPTPLPATSSYYLILTALVLAPYAHGQHLTALRASNLGPYQAVLTARLITNPTTPPGDRITWAATTAHIRPHAQSGVCNALLTLANDPHTSDVEAATAVDLALSAPPGTAGRTHATARRADQILAARPNVVALLARSGNRAAARAAAASTACTIPAVLDAPARIALAEYHDGAALAAWLLDELGPDAFNTMLGIELEFDGTLRELMHAARSLTD